MDPGPKQNQLTALTTLDSARQGHGVHVAAVGPSMHATGLSTIPGTVLIHIIHYMGYSL